MVQDQLTDYISAQMKLGVSRDAIKAALVGAGWAQMDVDDTFKKIDSAAVASPSVAAVSPMGQVSATRPASAYPTAGPSVSPSSISMGGAMKSPEKIQPQVQPQTIRVSDLVSGAGVSSINKSSIGPATMPVGAGTVNMKSPMASSPISSSTVKPMGLSSPQTKKSGTGWLGLAIAIVLAVVFAGAAGYFYWQNQTLTNQAGTVNAQGQNAGAQVASLAAQVQAFQASSTTMTAQIAGLTAEAQGLQTNLSFFVVPPGQISSSTQISFSGTVSGSASAYIVTTVYGVKVNVKNSSVAGVHTLLQPLLNATSTAQITGAYIPGTSNVTVLTVNGVSINATTTPAVVATTTVATTTPATTTATSSAQ